MYVSAACHFCRLSADCSFLYVAQNGGEGSPNATGMAFVNIAPDEQSVLLYVQYEGVVDTIDRCHLHLVCVISLAP